MRECLDCVLCQTLPFSAVCVVDNHSTDGTAVDLDALAGKFSQLQVFHLEKNLGGAGGFSYGLKQLAKSGCDWLLIIDDDAMLNKNYLEELDKAIQETDYLAYSGTVITQDAIDFTHRRRLKNPWLMTYEPVPETDYQKKAFEYDISTFCGLLIKTSLVRQMGLPKTEYFIWFDDTEYCLRFHKQSRILNVNRAVLNHKTTPTGNAPAVSWKNFYGFRNSIDIGKAYAKSSFLYLAYICANHMAHILIDSLGILLGNQQEMRRYRRQIYVDVLKGMGKKPDGIDSRYLPGSGYL